MRLYCRPTRSSRSGEGLYEVFALEADPEHVGQEEVDVGAECVVTDQIVVDRDAGERRKLDAPTLEEWLARHDHDVLP